MEQKEREKIKERQLTRKARKLSKERIIKIASRDSKVLVKERKKKKEERKMLYKTNEPLSFISRRFKHRARLKLA